MSYVTLADLKTYLGIPTATTTDDTLLTACISRAQAIIENLTGRIFEAKTETRFYDANDIDGQDLEMFGDDLLTVTTLTNGDGTVVDPANYYLLPRNHLPKYIIRLKEVDAWEFTDADSTISVAGTWGYTATPPDDIKQACLRAAAWLYRQKDTTADIDRPIMTGDGAVIMPAALPNDALKIIAKYARRI